MQSHIRLFVALLLTTALFIVVLDWTTHHPADLMLINGRIYTMDASSSVVEALAVRGTTIARVGTSDEIQRKFTANTVIDLQGKTVIPGLIDAHAHLLSLGVARLTVDLVGAGSEGEVAERVRRRVVHSGPNQWVRGRGWDQNTWPQKHFPHHRVLDRVGPDNPVYLTRVDGHAAWVSRRALDLSGITKDTQDPPGGRILRDASGNPTGVLIDAAMDLVRRVMPGLSEEEASEALQLAIQECLKYGLTSVQDMGADLEDIELYMRAIVDGTFPLRVSVAIGGAGETWEYYLKSGPVKKFGEHRLTVRAIKLYVDGALGSRGAALIDPYSDEPGNRGLTITGESELRRIVDQALARGFQVCTHAIGDRGNNIILNVYEAALQANPVRDHRLRVEHAQVLYPGDIPRFSRLGVVPSMQPTHCTSDMYWAEARLGATRVKGAYAWRSLLETGVVIPGGSDFPVEHPNPMLGIYAAVTRRDQEGRPRNADDVRRWFQISEDGIPDPSVFEGGWYASQAVSREEALRMFTTWAAWGAFEENLKGSLERGKLADFVVLSEDLLTVPEDRMFSVFVERTFLGGAEVYTRNPGPLP